MKAKSLIIKLFSILMFFVFFLSNTANIYAEGHKRIEVDLTNQKLYAYEADTVVYDFTISTGKPWWPTPTGVFKPWIKLRHKTMTGGSKYYGTYYYLPNVPYTIFFYNDSVPKWRGYAIHGTYWHNNFGHPMSHGCINLTIADAEKIYYFLEPEKQGTPFDQNEIISSTPIIVKGVTPAS